MSLLWFPMTAFFCNNVLNFSPSSVFSVVLIKQTPSSSSSSSSWTRHKDSLGLRDVKEQVSGNISMRDSGETDEEKSLLLPLRKGDSAKQTLMLTVDLCLCPYICQQRSTEEWPRWTWWKGKAAAWASPSPEGPIRTASPECQTYGQVG